MQFSISHVLFQRQLGLVFFDNHLSTEKTVRISVHFHPSHAPTKIWVASLRGLPRSIFYVSIKTSSLWHLRTYYGISKDLANLVAVTLLASLGLCIRLAQTLLASQPVLAWTFLMIATYHAIIQKLHCLNHYSTICLPKTSFSKRLMRFKISKLVTAVVAVAGLGASGFATVCACGAA